MSGPEPRRAGGTHGAGRASMRLGSALGEAWRNLASGTTRAPLFATLLLVVALAASVADARWVVGLSAQAQAFRDAGASVTVLNAAGAVDGRRCEALGEVAGVRAAGALRRGAALAVATAPRAALRPLEATPGMARILGVDTRVAPTPTPTFADDVVAPGPRAAGPSTGATAPSADHLRVAGEGATHLPTAGGTGVWVSAEVADTLGVRSGVVLAVSGGSGQVDAQEIAPAGTGPSTLQRPVRVAGVYSYSAQASVRDPAYAVLSPVPAAGTFDSCWMDVWPPSPATTALIWSAVLPRSEGAEGITTSQLDATLGSAFDGPGLLASRPTRHAPWVAGLGAAAVGVLAVRVRRLEIAGNLHAGVPRTAQGAQILLETAAWTLAALTIAAPVTYLAAWWDNPDPFAPAWDGALRALAAAGAGALLGALAATATVTERRLLRYFKDR